MKLLLKHTECVNFLTKQDDHFQVEFDHFEIKCHFFEAAEVVVKIGSSLKPKYQDKFLIVQMRETLCTINFNLHILYLNTNIGKNCII